MNDARVVGKKRSKWSINDIGWSLIKYINWSCPAFGFSLYFNSRINSCLIHRQRQYYPFAPLWHSSTILNVKLQRNEFSFFFLFRREGIIFLFFFFEPNSSMTVAIMVLHFYLPFTAFSKCHFLIYPKSRSDIHLHMLAVCVHCVTPFLKQLCCSYILSVVFSASFASNVFFIGNVLRKRDALTISTLFWAR